MTNRKALAARLCRTKTECRIYATSSPVWVWLRHRHAALQHVILLTDDASPALSRRGPNMVPATTQQWADHRLCTYHGIAASRPPILGQARLQRK
jgi:hypothetical protein